jgi:subfamily B ATP-binding cassette protein MsbA
MATRSLADPKPISIRQFWVQFILQPFISHRLRLATIAAALLLLAASTGLIILSLGPLVKVLFAAEPGGAVSIESVLPERLVKLWPGILPNSIDGRQLGTMIPLIILLAGMMKALSTYLYSLNQQAISLSVAMQLRGDLFRRLLSLPYLELKPIEPGSAMSMLMNDVSIIRAKFADFITNGVRDVLMVAAAILTMLLVNSKAAALLSLAAPVAGWLLGRGGMRIARFADQWQTQLRGLAGNLFEVRRRFEFMRAQGGEAWELSRFAKMNDRYLSSIRRSLLLRATYAPSVEFVGVVIFAIFVWFFFRQRMTSELVEQSIQFLAAMGLMVRPLKSLGEQIVNFAEAQGSLRKAIEIIHLSQRPAASALSAPAASTGENQSPSASPITVDHLVIAYENGPDVSISGLCLSPGKSIALVGPSGSGKSSIAKCLAGLIPPAVWNSSIAWSELVRESSYVSQTPFLFDQSIRDNLTYGMPAGQGSDADILRTLRLVGLEDMIQRGSVLDQSVAKFQGNFSGGQIQRLTIAHALLQPKKLLILDEATASLDIETEARILEALRDEARRRGLSILAITHRQNRFQDFDEVIFLEDGAVKFRGEHQALLEVPRYAEFCRMDSFN